MADKIIAEYDDIKAVADAIRTKKQITGDMSLKAMPSNVLSISGGSTLPTLTNAGTASDLLYGKQLIDGEGNVITGTYIVDNSSNTSPTGFENLLTNMFTADLCSLNLIDCSTDRKIFCFQKDINNCISLKQFSSSVIKNIPIGSIVIFEYIMDYISTENLTCIDQVIYDDINTHGQKLIIFMLLMAMQRLKFQKRYGEAAVVI